MTWLDIKKAALLKMDGASNGALNLQDASNQDYLLSFVYAANEAIQRISNAGKPVRKTLEIEPEAGQRAYILEDYASDFESFGDTIDGWLEDDDGNIAELPDVVFVGGRFLLFEEEPSATAHVWYNAKPVLITNNTKDNFVVPLDDDAVVLIPLYIAGEVMKADDSSLATMYMNEFEARLENLTRKPTFMDSSQFTNTKGWY